MCKVSLLLGGNLGDRENNIILALKCLESEVGEIRRQSGIYESKAWGNHQQPDFLNIAVQIETKLQPYEVLEKIQSIENLLERKREEKWGARTMDIDILFYDDIIIQSETLTVPHALIAERKFVLLPLSEILPNLKHPISKKTIKELLINCKDDLDVKHYLKS